jgi:hypothetical protein
MRHPPLAKTATAADLFQRSCLHLQLWDYCLNPVRYSLCTPSALMNRLKGRVANTLLPSYSDILLGRPTSEEHRHLDDELHKRLAFERAGVRLYDALISKHQGSAFPEKLPSLEILRRFREEEAQHFRLIAGTLRELGGDPTAITPAADVTATASLGWVQVMTDPRTTFAQCLEVILMAELVDNDGWEVLIQLAEAGKLTEVATQFRQALLEEAEHLVAVRAWVKQLTLPSSMLGPEVQAS